MHQTPSFRESLDDPEREAKNLRGQMMLDTPIASRTCLWLLSSSGRNLVESGICFHLLTEDAVGLGAPSLSFRS